MNAGHAKPEIEKPKPQPKPLLDLLDSMDEWLGNEDGLMIEDVIEWRDRLAAALGKGPRG